MRSRQWWCSSKIFSYFRYYVQVKFHLHVTAVVDLPMGKQPTAQVNKSWDKTPRLYGRFGGQYKADKVRAT